MCWIVSLCWHAAHFSCGIILHLCLLTLCGSQLVACLTCHWSRVCVTFLAAAPNASQFTSLRNLPGLVVFFSVVTHACIVGLLVHFFRHHVCYLRRVDNYVPWCYIVVYLLRWDYKVLLVSWICWWLYRSWHSVWPINQDRDMILFCLGVRIGVLFPFICLMLCAILFLRRDGNLDLVCE